MAALRVANETLGRPEQAHPPEHPCAPYHGHFRVCEHCVEAMAEAHPLDLYLPPRAI